MQNIQQNACKNKEVEDRYLLFTHHTEYILTFVLYSKFYAQRKNSGDIGFSRDVYMQWMLIDTNS